MNNLRQLQLPVENAMIKAAFAGWMELGNRNPADWDGATDGVRDCLKFARGGFLDGDLRRLVAGRAECRFCKEIEVYGGALTALTNGGEGLEETLENLCQLSYVGNGRARRVLAGLGFVLFEGEFEVPGVDDGKKRVEAGEFFLECGEPSLAAKALSTGEWWGREAYLCGGRLLLDQGLTREATVAFKIGHGLGDSGCGGYLVAMDRSHGKMDARQFRIVQVAAERGFQLPLVVAARALLDGEGIDPDPLLSSFYESLTGKGGGVEGGNKKDAKTRKGGGDLDFFEIIFSWAGKHPDDPIFLEAAKRWRGAVQRKIKAG